MEKLIVLLILLFIGGGLTAVCVFIEGIWEAIKAIFIGFFPVFKEFGKMALEDYLTSPYFIVGVIMFIGSCFGFWFGKKGGKILYIVVSIICGVISLASMGINIFG